jgi:hypothetical protein
MDTVTCVAHVSSRVGTRRDYAPYRGRASRRHLEVSQPYPNRGDSEQVRVYLEVRLTREPGPVQRTFYSLAQPDGSPLLVDAWGKEVEA